MDETRTALYHLQSNAVMEQTNKTLQIMFAKCVNEEQSNWSQQLPYVLMAYRSSVLESTGYTPLFLVFEQKLNLPSDCLYPKPEKNNTTDIHDFLHNKRQAFQRVDELVRRNFNEKQKPRNAIYKKFLVKHTKNGKKFCCITQFLL